ncbi:hypothetical protein RHS04_01123 [Rhizoctonia solani]|uniref:T6SS Phospholipase effector Tle1-like catalytic domain-containing protein n=1 Tax=Rhizoctonia solani TaxID=456999 RepID=A0A8H7HDN8_9AGAM|nr:hypothetical protein RHS04_01123 [Rhizoctonia solani]
MTVPASDLFDPPHGSKLFVLEILPWLSTEHVIVRATPTEDSDCVFENPEDAEFDLSQHIGINAYGQLEWGLSGFELAAKNPEIRSYKNKDRWLCVQLTDDTENPQRALNLDDCLALVEYYDEDAGEIRTKLGQKPVSSKRSIILCFDGTSNHFSNQNTNVVKLVELLKKDDPSQQLPGVGTYSAPGLLTRLGEKIACIADEGIAWYLYQHVIDGYKYLMQTYRAGDQVCIFGFSRGAYTARALAGMLHSVGLLPRDNMEQVSFAYQIYVKSDKQRRDKFAHVPSAVKITAGPEEVEPDAFKSTFCVPITITFLGVWDTVGSVGLLTEKNLPFIEHNPSVLYFRQALALDENRGNFIPSVWDHSRTTSSQNVLEVWFKGGHCDVGGGAGPPERFIPPNEHPEPSVPRLSNISLRWMIRQCLTPGIRILFDPKVMRRYRKRKILETRTPGNGTESIENYSATLDQFDVRAKPTIMHDRSWWWKSLDCIPVPKLEQTPEDPSEPGTKYWPNFGASRIIHRPASFEGRAPIRLHASVCSHIVELAAEKKVYVPAARWFNPKADPLFPIMDESIGSSVISKDKHEPVQKALWMVWSADLNQSWWSSFTKWLGWI